MLLLGRAHCNLKQMWPSWSVKSVGLNHGPDRSIDLVHVQNKTSRNACSWKLGMFTSNAGTRHSFRAR